MLLIVRDAVNRLENRLGKLEFPIAITNGMLPVVSGLCSNPVECPINVSFKQWGGHQFSSALFRYKDHADIICDVDLNLCWQRFSVCKEAAHLIIDSEQKHFTTDIENLIQGLITFPVISLDDVIDSEMVGEVAAVELLLPWKLRPTLVGLRESGVTDLELAELCRVPQKYISLLRGTYGTSSDRANRQLDGTD